MDLLFNEIVDDGYVTYALTGFSYFMAIVAALILFVLTA